MDFRLGARQRGRRDGSTSHHGHLELFRNYDEHGNRLRAPNTLLIDSEQLESGEALDNEFRDMAAAEIEQFKREHQRSAQERAARRENHRSGPAARGDEHGRQEGRLGEQVRCVVSVSMLTEGLGHQHRHPHPRRPRLRHPASVRAGGRARACAANPMT